MMLNDEKILTHQNAITFMGHVTLYQGAQTDSEKIFAVTNMLAPTYITSVKRFCEMVQYLSRFLPHHVDNLEPFYKLEGIQ